MIIIVKMKDIISYIASAVRWLDLPPRLGAFWVRVFRLSAIGAYSIILYVRNARRTVAPILDLSLFRYRTLKIAVSGSFIVRAGAVGALPFLLAMMLRVGFGLTPFESGSIVFVGAVATLMTKFILSPMPRLFGVRKFLAGMVLFGALTMVLLTFVTETTPHKVIMAIIFLGTLFRVLRILGLESMIFADVPQSEMGQASCLLSVVKQFATSAGVAYAGLMLQGAQIYSDSPIVSGGDFRVAIALVAIPLALTVMQSLWLCAEDGDEISGRGQGKHADGMFSGPNARSASEGRLSETDSDKPARLARQAIQAKEAGVFFRIEDRPRQDTPVVTGQSKQMAATFPVFSLIECA